MCDYTAQTQYIRNVQNAQSAHRHKSSTTNCAQKKRHCDETVELATAHALLLNELENLQL